MSAETIRSRAIYAVFFCSGASALVYQVLWARRLSLAFGSTTASNAVVLGAFMAGLALGSRVVGRRLPAIARPLRAYALVELGIGVFAVTFPLWSRLAELAFAAVVTPDTPSTFALGVRAVLSFALLLAPTVLMGATLPLLTEFFRRHPRASRGWKVGALYAANTFGAAVGVAVTALVLIELVGMLATTVAAALLNAAIAAFAWRLSRGETATAGEPIATATVASSTMLGQARFAIAVLAVTGALALGAEVLWMRTLQTFLGTSTYAFSTIVFVFLVGIAAGSAVVSRFVDRVRDATGVLLALVAGMGCWIAVAVALFQVLAGGADVARGQPLSLLTIFGLYARVGLLLLPLAFASGACFPLATRVIEPTERDAHGALIARAYAWNTWGAVAGSLGAGFVIAPLLDYFGALHVLTFCYLAGAAGLALVQTIGHAEHRRRRAGLAVGCLALGVALGAWLHSRPSYAERVAARQGREVVMHRPGVQAVTTVVRKPGVALASSLFVNGQGMTVKVTDTKMMAHFPLLLHPDPQDTLVICFGMGTTFRSALSYGGKVTVVEIVEGVADAFPHFYADAATVLANPRGRIVIDDGRTFLTTTEQRFDVITLDPPPPIDGAGVNNLYSRDFAELARSRLKPHGIVAHWIPFVGKGAGVDDQRTFEMLVQTFAGAFSHVYALVGINGVGLHLIGSLEPLDTSVATIERRLATADVAADLREFQAVPAEYFGGIAEIAASNEDELIITDDLPLLEFYLVRTALTGGKKTLTHHLW